MTLAPDAAVGLALVVLSVFDDQLVVLVADSREPTSRNRLALAGGPLNDDEDLPDAAGRHVWEWTGLEPDRVHLDQLATYLARKDDPRGRTLTVAYLVLAYGQAASLSADGDPAWGAVAELVDNPSCLAVDHFRILADGVGRAQAKLEYSPAGAALCPDEFTIGDLRRVYEAVWDTDLDPRNFHRKVSGTPDFLVETGRITSGEGGRPARLYRLGDATVLHPPMVRPV